MSSPMSSAAPPGPVEVVYDGECPFCASYIALLRLRERVGEVRLIDARQAPEVVAALGAEGYDLDQGMVVRAGGRVFHGDEALSWLAAFGGGRGVWPAINRALFSNARVARAAYPALRAGRALALRLLGRSPIGPGRAA